MSTCIYAKSDINIVVIYINLLQQNLDICVKTGPKKQNIV